jgi:hypothetical protein
MRLPHRHHRFNAQQLTLFAWADSRERIALPFPARVLASRYGLSPQRAALVAQLAGYGGRQ